MPIKGIPHQKLKGCGWNTRGYLPHFDGVAIPQFITLNLVDAIPLKVIVRCSTGAAGDGRAPTEERTRVKGWGF